MVLARVPRTSLNTSLHLSRPTKESNNLLSQLAAPINSKLPKAKFLRLTVETPSNRAATRLLSKRLHSSR
jgi:hypothetical protein